MAADGGLRPHRAAARQGAERPSPPSSTRSPASTSREYLEILRAVSAGDWVPHAARYGLGPGDNPIFPGLWEAAQLVRRRLAAGGPAGRRRRGHARLPLRGRAAPRHARTAPPASATSTTRCWPSCALRAARACGWPTWTSTPITATACSSRSTTIPTCSPSPPTSAATGSSRAPASSRRWARARASGTRSTCRSSRSPTTRSTTTAFEAVVPPLVTRLQARRAGASSSASIRTGPIRSPT